MIKRFGGAILGLVLVLGAIGASSITAQAQYQRNGKWDRDRYSRRDRDRDYDRRWRNRRNDRLHGRGYNNGRYGYPGNNNGRYGNGRYNDRYGNYGGNSYELNRGYQQHLASMAQRGFDLADFGFINHGGFGIGRRFHHRWFVCQLVQSARF